MAENTPMNKLRIWAAHILEPIYIFQQAQSTYKLHTSKQSEMQADTGSVAHEAQRKLVWNIYLSVFSIYLLKK